METFTLSKKNKAFTDFTKVKNPGLKKYRSQNH